MADTVAGISIKDVQASVKRIQDEGERLVGRLRKEARAITQRPRVSEVVADVRKLRVTVRERAEQALEQVRTSSAATTLREQVTRVAETVIQRLGLATKDDVAELSKRLVEIEQRLEDIAKTKAA
jgi:methyl-accepting chemotaxis protein